MASRSALRLAHVGTPDRHHTAGERWRLSLLAVEWHQGEAARQHRRLIDASLGNVLPATAAWRAAEANLERALAHERVCRLAARGEHVREVPRG